MYMYKVQDDFTSSALPRDLVEDISKRCCVTPHASQTFAIDTLRTCGESGPSAVASACQEEMHRIASVGAARVCGGRHSEMRRK